MNTAIIMIFVAFFNAVCVIGGIGGAVFLVTDGHPWFALLVLLAGVTGGHSYSYKESKRTPPPGAEE